MIDIRLQLKAAVFKNVSLRDMSPKLGGRCCKTNTKMHNIVSSHTEPADFFFLPSHKIGLYLY